MDGVIVAPSGGRLRQKPPALGPAPFRALQGMG